MIESSTVVTMTTNGSTTKNTKSTKSLKNDHGRPVCGFDLC